MAQIRRFNHHREDRDETWCGWSQKEIPDDYDHQAWQEHCPELCNGATIEEASA
ncbi:hypothetical protein [Actinomadura kijaniata]|uniref:hypothetical protein n=1 Tax=Actinomadura kijaniata TaxID=46161 RepID=UPI0012F975B2|nr:hypothetical protein [Actinomadura kijaniata]